MNHETLWVDPTPYHLPDPPRKGYDQRQMTAPPCVSGPGCGFVAVCERGKVACRQFNRWVQTGKPQAPSRVAPDAKWWWRIYERDE